MCVWYKNLDRSISSVLSQFTRLTDRETDGQKSHRYTASALHSMQTRCTSKRWGSTDPVEPQRYSTHGPTWQAIRSARLESTGRQVVSCSAALKRSPLTAAADDDDDESIDDMPFHLFIYYESRTHKVHIKPAAMSQGRATSSPAPCCVATLSAQQCSACHTNAHSRVAVTGHEY